MAGTKQKKSAETFTAEERAAMKEHAQEQKKAASRRGSRAEKAAAVLQDVLAKIAEMPDADRVIAERVHAIVTDAGPDLEPRLWYGMPAYSLDGKVLCFLQAADKFGARYATLGFNDVAKLDDGPMWPTAYAITKITPAVEKQVRALVTQAVG